MTITLEHVPSPQRDTSPAAQPGATRTAPRTGLLALLGEAIAAARAVDTAHPYDRVAVAARFAERISA